MTEATIEIRSRNVEKTDWLGYVNDKILGIFGAEGVPQHTFIIYTDSNNQTKIMRGGPERNNMLTDNILIINAPYTEEYKNLFPGDFVENAPSRVIATGTDAQMQAIFDKMWDKAQEINAGKFDYKLPTPGCPASLCHVQNSNTVVKVLVESAGLKFALPTVNNKEVWAPGIDGIFKHTVIDPYTGKVTEKIINTYQELKTYLKDATNGYNNADQLSYNTLVGNNGVDYNSQNIDDSRIKPQRSDTGSKSPPDSDQTNDEAEQTIQSVQDTSYLARNPDAVMYKNQAKVAA